MALTISVKPRSGPGSRPIHLSAIGLRNVGRFEQLVLDVEPPSDGDRGQWIVLLGPNGTGKSTILRSVALALEGHRSSDAYLSMLGRRFVRAGAAHANIVVTARGVPTELEVTPGPPDVPTGSTGGAKPLDVFGYGATRGTALGGTDRDVDLGRHRYASTLFSGTQRLIHAETWIRRQALRDRTSLSRLLDTLGSLLPDRARLELRGDELHVLDTAGHAVPFESLSDGYLTTLGWTIDLIAQWSSKYADIDRAHVRTDDMPCVVLVDEIDLHLHPEWQLDIIPRLRTAFPKTTFVVTTHNPLTLQGTRPGEVFVLERDAEGTIGITQRDITPGLDANRILTDWFGLPTTLDNDTRDLMAEHLKLLWEKVPESHARRRALERTLRERLGRYADTSLERIAQSVVAEVLHKKSGGPLADITPADRSEIVTQVEARLDVLDAPSSTSSAREPMPTWRRKTTSKPRKATTTSKTATKRKATTTRKTTPKR